MSLTQAYDPDNIFAKIIKGDIPSVKVHEDDDILVFMDVFPQSEGHTLIIPKKAQATNLLEVDGETLSKLMAATQKIAQAVNKALKPDGIRIAQFNGSRAGQTVFHIHFHVIPAYEGKATAPHAAGKPADPAELEKIAAKIRAAL
jgi:histidine triad (HIT) family protein